MQQSISLCTSAGQVLPYMRTIIQNLLYVVRTDSLYSLFLPARTPERKHVRRHEVFTRYQNSLLYSSEMTDHSLYLFGFLKIVQKIQPGMWICSFNSLKLSDTSNQRHAAASRHLEVWHFGEIHLFTLWLSLLKRLILVSRLFSKCEATVSNQWAYLSIMTASRFPLFPVYIC